MPTTRPGFIWSGTEWVAIGQEAVVNPFYYQATAPVGAATGAIWIESDVDVPSIDSSQFLRWRKTMTGGETSLSGNDDSSLPLAYTPGYEQLYINGVLQVRGQDYTATTGTTVTGLTALVANDVVEIFSAVARTVADVYTQAQADAKYALQTNFPAGAWTTWTPTISAASGAITSYTIQRSKYVQLGKTIHMNVRFTITNNGTGAGSVGISLPVTALEIGAVGVGRENAATGAMIQGFMGSTTLVSLFTSSNSYPGGTNYIINFSMTYERA